MKASASTRSGNLFLLAVAAYFVLQIALRLSLSDSLDLDEAEQVLGFRQLALGYGTQPPLYAWLQWLMFSVFGVNLFSLAALKNLLLFGTYTCVFFLARPLVGAGGAVASSASLLLIPQIAWESQRDLTHSVLLACLASATLCCYFALLRKPSAARYALFGLLVGLGLQSKYNFTVFAAALVAASLLVAEHRRTLWNAKALIAAAVALLCLAPHGAWLLQHAGTAAGGTLRKMQEGGRDVGYLRNVVSGMGSLLLSVVAFLTPLWLVLALACRRLWKEAVIDRRSPNARFFLFFLAASFAWLTVLILTGKVVKIKDRWLQPLLFVAPLAFFVVLPGMSQPIVHRRMVRVAAVFAAVILLALPLRAYVGPKLGKDVRANHPYPQLSAELARQFPHVKTQIVGDKLAAGNLMFNRPGMRTLVLAEALSVPVSLREETLLLVRTDSQAGWLERFQAAHPDAEVRQNGQIKLPYRQGGAEILSFDFALVGARSQ